jgi:hypothetical protein
LSFVQAQHYRVALESRAIRKLNHKSETVRIRLRGLDAFIRVLNRWLLPHWGKFELRAIKSIAVAQSLKTLVTRKFGKPTSLAGGTREKIRDAMSSVFNHAIRWEFADCNPITGPGRLRRSGLGKA